MIKRQAFWMSICWLEMAAEEKRMVMQMDHNDSREPQSISSTPGDAPPQVSPRLRVFQTKHHSNLDKDRQSSSSGSYVVASTSPQFFRVSQWHRHMLTRDVRIAVAECCRAIYEDITTGTDR